MTLETAEDVYRSRVAALPHLSPRLDPVVYDGGPVSNRLSGAELDSYSENGFLFVEKLLDAPAIRALTAELRSLANQQRTAPRPETVIEPGSQEVRSIFRIHQLSTVFEQLARDARVVDVARQILGSEVYIHQSRANLKPEFAGKPFYWHSDFETWHVEDGMPRMRALSVSIALTDNYSYNGPLMLIPGSHRTFVSCVGETPEDHYKHSLKRQEYGVPDHESLRSLADEGGIAAPVGPAGSAVFFDCNAMHGSNSNITPYPRTNLFFVYNSVENALREPYCGLKPRPEHIATRSSFEPLAPIVRS